MQKEKRGQISTEYVIIISFVLFLVLSTLGIAFFYSAQIRDAIKFHQIESFSQKLTSLSESIYYSGEPSRTTMTGYLPEGINELQILDYFIVYNVSTNSGNAITAFRSNVKLSGSISPSSGLRKIYLNATEDSVVVYG
ncbi:MAG: hypothetical protein KJ600_03425 [Nanoarchaeota archaeon]|nr:hypothetical protein [Nanoarchaeota archaeon]MBU1103578.1 hypothetical protein [Nanoarchaeota archaeon]